MRHVLEWLERQCALRPDAIALKDAQGACTYAELRRSAKAVAGTIPAGEGVRMVAVYLPKSIRCLSAMLGALYAGCAYVPLDTRAPLRRNLAILSTAEPCAVITDEQGEKALRDAALRCPLLTSIPETDDENISASALTDSDPACLLFTSGSTGVPKGVVIPHRRILRYIEWGMEAFSIGEGDVIASQAPFYFTVSTMDIYLCLAAGAQLLLLPESAFARPGPLMRTLDEEGVSLIFWVSSVYHSVALHEALEEVRPASLRHCWFVGEPMQLSSLAYWMERLPYAEFVNMYGSTETDMTLFHVMTREDIQKGRIPLGRSCPNVRLLLEGEGEKKELLIGGSALALGYYRNEEQTRRAFVQNPTHQRYPDPYYRTGDLASLGEEGLLYFHGRKDHQFKHLGYRIEAGDIESAAGSFPGLRHGCVLYHEDKRQIVLFYEAEAPLDEALLRRHLLALLPVYMIPTRYIALEALPFNANGKKNRPLLHKTYLEEEK